MLLRNGLSTNVIPLSLLGAGWQNFQRDDVQMLKATGYLGTKAAIPSGYGMRGFSPPMTAGGLNSHRLTEGSATAALSMASGINLSGLAAGTTPVASATMQLVVSMAGAAAGTSTVDGNVRAALALSGVAAGSSTASALWTAVAWRSGLAAGASTATLASYAVGHMAGTLISQSDVTLDLLAIASYAGEVAVDQAHGTPGTAFPAGTHEFPVNNFADAMVIATRFGLETLSLHGSCTLTTGDNVAGMRLVGGNVITTQVTVMDGADVVNCQFEDMMLSNSIFDGNVYLNHCAVSIASGIEGYVENSMLSGALSLTGTANTYFVDCKSGCVGLGTADLPVLSMTGSGRHVAFRNFSGPIKITNSTDPANTICLDIASGATITLDATCTAGTVFIRGIANVVNNSAMTVSTAALQNPQLAAESVWAHASGAQMITRLTEAWGRLGLDPSKPLITGQTSITFGDIAMALTGNATSTTVTRTP